jgi:hypothetical protein
MATLTEDVLQRRFEELVSRYRLRNNNMMAWRNLYFMRPDYIFQDDEGNVKPKAPDEERLVLPRPNAMVNTMLELILTRGKVITVPQSEASTEMSDVAEHNEKALYALNESGGYDNRIYDAMFHGLVDGWGVLQVLYDTAYDKDAGESPIIGRAVDPRNVYAMPGRRPDSWAYVMHAWERTVGEVRDEWVSGRNTRKNPWRAAKASLEGMKDTDKVTFIDYWDAEVNAVGISYNTSQGGNTRGISKWIKPPAEHGYGFLPWVLFFPVRTPFYNAPEQVGLSVLFPVNELMRYEDRLVSRKATMLNRYADPPLVTKTEDGRGFKPVFTEAGMHLALETTESAEYLINPGPPAQMDAQLALINSEAERSTLPGEVYGQGTGGGRSAMAVNILRNPTLMKVAFKQESLERAVEAVNSMSLRLVERFCDGRVGAVGRDKRGRDFEFAIRPAKSEVITAIGSSTAPRSRLMTRRLQYAGDLAPAQGVL